MEIGVREITGIYKRGLCIFFGEKIPIGVVLIPLVVIGVGAGCDGNYGCGL